MEFSVALWRAMMPNMALPVVNPQHHPARQGFERIARDAAERFRGKNLRVRRSPVVHAVGWYRWLGDLYLPGPACRTGWAGVGAQNDLRAVEVWQPINCQKCEHRPEAAAVRRFVPEPAVQLELIGPKPPGMVLFDLADPDVVD